MSKKIIFLDRDGTLIDEPTDMQVDALAKLKLKKNIIPALLKLRQAGYVLIMVSNQDGLGTETFPHENFLHPQQFLLELFKDQGIEFDEILICPHVETEKCFCRKPQLGLLIDYLRDNKMNSQHSYVIGDRATDMQLAKNLGIQGILYDNAMDWLAIVQTILTTPRTASLQRLTTETTVRILIDLDQQHSIEVHTGIGFFDHMLMQLAKHGGFGLVLNVNGDLHVDEHHTVEDTAIVLGTALRQALTNKHGIQRYGFLLPMDEALATIAIDLCDRGYCVFEGKFLREKVGELPTELIEHFFRSFAMSLKSTIQIKVTGENTHHMIESIFKGVGQCLRQAIMKNHHDILSTKGTL